MAAVVASIGREVGANAGNLRFPLRKAGLQSNRLVAREPGKAADGVIHE